MRARIDLIAIGSIGRRQSRKWRNSALVMLPLILLHRRQQVSVFSSVCSPPRWMGMMWSREMVFSFILVTQYWHRACLASSAFSRIAWIVMLNGRFSFFALFLQLAYMLYVRFLRIYSSFCFLFMSYCSVWMLEPLACGFL